MSAKGGARKKWTKATNKEKREWAVIITPEQAADMAKSVPKNKVISAGKLAERYKISLTCARKALEALTAEGKIVPVINGHDLKCYGPHPDHVVEKVEEVKEEAKKPAGKKGGKKQ
ncbi:hypothetical protein TVAG_426530 [Trichomonas vaginalis G3]|uniref:40S ribosomal protein S25 n=1 Tax=Trichomonas vaginalis (strain ATCC PRA-98 / G3) TaxID=412133 RepID=A2DYS0_TRIV3|nr:40S ribosomal protein S25 [Trichomonas vaginalis G3]XP_001330420.1 40S ribosomal protein S25 [Trichomonas vaginalis G3]EAY01794.1 hypothetical protein TVAG_111510 [Trichomonas vaginalis G3]EAY14460.1 hypothetical protein TVAG_426530 [Trichomonas vaginalis G3]KAI5519640.1 40S ribosomal protein S25 [Trichomonas vaginalis G3]KAI5546824.1 40S ribosomal protein S25 [Trichomonas vaginalis G3]|eukprot:XP_001326683.1 hypothetical protein [Trichomonas vaginalis G3]